jgi:hypothetical protein
MNLATLLDGTPRLRGWTNIGPVQRAELEQFANALLEHGDHALTADGELVLPGSQVWVCSSFGAAIPARVLPIIPYTNYGRRGPVPVARAWSSKQAAEIYQQTNF